MRSAFLNPAQADQPVYITDVRKAFRTADARPFHIHVTLYDDTVRCFPLRLSAVSNRDEAEFVRSYASA